jgi:aryl-alcohol dehydrogenase-like predicted oxidoreductase
MTCGRWAWCLRQPAVDAIITGTKSVDQLESSVVAVELAVGSEG